MMTPVVVSAYSPERTATRMMLLTRSSLTLLLLILLSNPAISQFTCTFSGAKDVTSCIDSTSDGSNSDHCVWCTLGNADIALNSSSTNSAFGFCVSEQQAEEIEQTVPIAHCDRYHGNSTSDDDDDYAMVDDDQSPSDDTIPDNYWECLKAKDTKECGKQNGCTWCIAKDPAGYGICIGGPSAEMARQSTFYSCDDESSVDINVGTITTKTSMAITDPLDPTCLQAFLQDPTPEACKAATDGDGQACVVCSMQGTDLCLNEEQAQIAEIAGLDCDDTSSNNNNSVTDPLDPSCLQAFLQDPTPEGCKAATDADGEACQMCSIQGMDLCLNEDQVQIGELVGLDCDDAPEVGTTSGRIVTDPLDPSCLQAFLQNPTPEGCKAATDADGEACLICSLQGTDLCLNEEQAQIAEIAGLDCDDDNENTENRNEKSIVADPLDPTCLQAFLQDPSPDACKAAVDADGDACQFCSIQGMDLCLNEEQAQIGELIGLECDEVAAAKKKFVAARNVHDPMDPSCLVAFLQDPTADGCSSAADADGNPCEFCSIQGGAVQVCLNEEQAAMGEQFGMSCDDSVELYDPLDPACALAYVQDPSPSTCTQTEDSDGSPCEFCVIGELTLCLNHDQASIGQQAVGMQCGATSALQAGSVVAS